MVFRRLQSGRKALRRQQGREDGGGATCGLPQLFLTINKIKVRHARGKGRVGRKPGTVTNSLHLRDMGKELRTVCGY